MLLALHNTNYKPTGHNFKSENSIVKRIGESAGLNCRKNRFSYFSTTESKTRTFFQLSLFSSMNCLCRAWS